MSCGVIGCGEQARARGWCVPHYHRWRRHGDPTGTGSRARARCTACGEPAHANKLCRLHWRRWRETGDPGAGRPHRMAPRTDDGLKHCTGCRQDLPLSRFARSRARKDGRNGHCRDCLASWRRRSLAVRRAARRVESANRRARLRAAGGRATVAQVEARWAYYGGRCWVCRGPATQTDHVKPVAAGGTGWPANLRPICRACNRAKSGRWPYAVPAADWEGLAGDAAGDGLHQYLRGVCPVG